MQLKVITPEETVFDGEISSVYLQTESGMIGVLPEHTDMVSKVVPGEIRITHSGKTTRLASGEGMLRIDGMQITILTDLAEDEGKIDEKAADDARKRAEEALKETLSSEEYAETLAILERSLAKLRVKRRHH